MPEQSANELDHPRSRSRLRLKTYIFIASMVALNPISNILLKKGMDLVGPMPGWAPSSVLHFFTSAFSMATIWLAVACLLGFFVSYLMVLSWADYTFVQPSAALSNGLTAVLAIYLLHEHISPVRWLGIACICGGVFVVGRTHPQTGMQI
ncbi:MAG: EamA family transporter [Acidobacteriota bacterium]|nr:EamA family transporter [Acidobacteriota bacterium]MDE3170043.1 EamA family transporter [Acidobacteriota bacterium]